MRMESTRVDKVYGVTVVLAVLEKMTMSGWLMTPWQWPITMTLLMMIQTVSSILTSLTLSLSPATVLLPRHGPDWWEFIQRPIGPTQADLCGGIYSTHINCISLVTNNSIKISMISWGISGISSQWRVGGHLASTEREDGAEIPIRGWKVDGDGGWQDDGSLTVNGKKENLNSK